MARTLTKRELSEEILFGPLRTSSREAMHMPSYSANGGNKSLLRWPDPAAPHLVPLPVTERSARKAPLVVQVNRLLQVLLVAFCALALIGYGMDVAVSNDVTRLQEQTRRLSEQNSELSAQLLKAISFQGIQESALGHVGLRVPEQVMIVKEVQPAKVSPVKSTRHFLPLMSGY
jgi:hypothetical protein